MFARRTLCPGLPVWEDAVDYGYIWRNYIEGKAKFVSVSDTGLALLQKYGRKVPQELTTA